MEQRISADYKAGNILISTPINGNIPKRRKKLREYYQDGAFNFAEEEEILWRAVILQALVDVTTFHRDPDLAGSKLDAIRWLTISNQDFMDVCLCACLDPNEVRVMAKKAIANPGAWRVAAGNSLRYLERKAMRARKRFLRRRDSTPTAPAAATIISFQ